MQRGLVHHRLLVRIRRRAVGALRGRRLLLRGISRCGSARRRIATVAAARVRIVAARRRRVPTRCSTAVLLLLRRWRVAAGILRGWIALLRRRVATALLRRRIPTTLLRRVATLLGRVAAPILLSRIGRRERHRIDRDRVALRAVARAGRDVVAELAARRTTRRRTAIAAATGRVATATVGVQGRFTARARRAANNAMNRGRAERLATLGTRRDHRRTTPSRAARKDAARPRSIPTSHTKRATYGNRRFAIGGAGTVGGGVTAQLESSIP